MNLRHYCSSTLSNVTQPSNDYKFIAYVVCHWIRWMACRKSTCVEDLDLSQACFSESFQSPTAHNNLYCLKLKNNTNRECVWCYLVSFHTSFIISWLFQQLLTLLKFTRRTPTLNICSERELKLLERNLCKLEEKL